MTYGGGLVALAPLGLRGGHEGQVLDHLGGREGGEKQEAVFSRDYLLGVFCLASTRLAGTEDGLVLAV